VADKRSEPRIFKAFRQHGVSLIDAEGNQGQGVCPWCGKNKLFVNKENGLWDCKTCSRKGNLEKFFEMRANDYQKNMKGKITSFLRDNRNIKASTLQKFGVGYSIKGEFYSIPISGNPKNYTTDIHRYYPKLKKALGTSGGRLTLFAPKGQKDDDLIYVMEGEWDAMAMYECLHANKASGMVYGIAGAGSLPKRLSDLFENKHIIMVMDNDRAGNIGSVRAQSFLGGIAKSVKFIHWPDTFKDGYDFRDHYIAKGSGTLVSIMKMSKSEPCTRFLTAEDDHLKKDAGHADNRVPAAQHTEQEKAKLIGKRPAATYIQTNKSFKKWLSMKSTEALDVMFGTILANRLEGDPLWLFMVAPPGGSKTELLMSTGTSPLVTSCTSITPHTLISGANFAGGGDPSLLPKLDQRVLVVKDFTTIMAMNHTARDEIFGQLRDAYDGLTEKVFGNGVSRRYESKFGIIAGVTPAIEQFSGNSVLGERFLKYHIPHSTAVNTGRDAIKQALKNIASENTMRSDLLVAAKKVLEREVSKEDIPEMDDEIIDKITSLAQWVARLRGVVTKDRYTQQIMSKPCAEIGTRLAKQLAKLAIGISIYRQDEVITDDTYRIIASVACSTAPDRVEEIVKQMYVHSPDEEKTTNQVADLSHFPAETVRFVLQDLALLRIVIKTGGDYRGNWILSPVVRSLMKRLNLYNSASEWRGAVNKSKVKHLKKKRRK